MSPLVGCKAGGGAQRPGKVLWAISESRVRAGISQGKPSSCSCSGSRGSLPVAHPGSPEPAAAPQSRGAREAERPQSGGAQGWKRRACGAWIPAPFRRECSVRSVVQPPGKEQSNCSLPQRSLVTQASRLPKRAYSRAAEPSRARGLRLGARRRPRGSEPRQLVAPLVLSGAERGRA